MRRDVAESLGEVVGTRNDAAASHYHRPNGYLAGIASRHSFIKGTAHAEMQAITSAANQLGGKYLTDCTLYVTLEPCIMCAGAIGWSQIRRVVYGATDDKRGYSQFAPKAFHPKCTVTTGVLEDECRELMTQFFKSRR